jgi:hypothetical protein
MGGMVGTGFKSATISTQRYDSINGAVHKPMLQVIFAGQCSNHTQTLIMKRSILIEVYRSAHQMIENNFYLTHRTINHSSPKMLRTMNKLRAYIESSERNPHVYTKGRSVHHEIPDYVSNGFALLTEDADLCAIAEGNDKSGGAGVSSDDIGVN